MYTQIAEDEFENLKKEYAKENNSYKKTLVFHVGTQAGFYSEVGSIFEAMCYCHLHQIKFILYADDANFSNNQGWTVFFEEFCQMSHDEIHKTANLRSAKNDWQSRLKRYRLKKQLGISYFTSDLFYDIIGPELKATPITWSLFGMNGTVYPEAGKLKQLILRYNPETLNAINTMIASVNLPSDYVSVQIRGGDKITETDHLTNASETVELIRQSGDFDKIHDIFVFTDDYANIRELQVLCPSWNIYTLCREDETGYYFDDFNASNWASKKNDLIKLFAMVEICISSKKHYAYEKSCANNIIRNVKPPEEYQAIIKTFY
jgi:hypothetical protein